MRGDCCHYDEGYDEGYEEGKRAAKVPEYAIPALDLLDRAAAALYAVDPLSLIALECEQTRRAILDDMPREARRLVAS